MSINYPIVNPDEDILAADFNTLRKDVVRNAGDYGVTGGSANAQTLTIDSGIGLADIIDGFKVRFEAGFTTTSSTPTLNVNATGALTLVNRDNNTLNAALVAGGYYEAVKKGSNWIVANLLDPQFTVPNIVLYEAGSQITPAGNTQIAVTNPHVNNNNIWRYAYTGSGPNPNFSSATLPVGTVVDMLSTNLGVGNYGRFNVIDSGTNFFEVYKASGTVTTNTLGTNGALRTRIISRPDYVYIKSANLAYIEVEVVGGGGGSSCSDSSNRGAGGGGGGGYSKKIIPASALGATETVTIGYGGTLGTNTTTSGGTLATPGGTTRFGSHCSAEGGAASGSGYGGAGGIGVGGDINLTGNGGGRGAVVGTGVGADAYTGGIGGGSFFGGGAASNGAIEGKNYGGGASGPGAGTSAGRNGGNGVVKITEHFVLGL